LATTMLGSSARVLRATWYCHSPVVTVQVVKT
jgi:hypothetical protein